jgi:thiol-disulfide isomerase/thioredoxin
MAIVVRSFWLALTFCEIFTSASTVLASDRSAQQILKELDAAPVPRVDAAKRNDDAYLQQFLPKREQVRARRDELILELYRASPRHPRTPKLMAERWQHCIGAFPESIVGLKEIDEVLALDGDPELNIEGTYIKAVAKIRVSESAGLLDFSEAEHFIRLAPQDDRCAVLLRIAGRNARDEKSRVAIEDRAIKDYPNSEYARYSIRRRLRSESDPKKKVALEEKVLTELPRSDLAKAVLGARLWRDAIGKPFDLVFVDAIGGSTVSIKRLKGTVVVINFWATWCGPCVAETSHLKELYSKYHDQAVEFIGVSLDRPADQGGLERLKTFVNDKGITWPQYYQDDGGLGGFSQSWGIQSIPAVFVVDSDGNLYSGDAQGKLDMIIDELIHERGGVTDKKGATGAK